MKNNNRNNWIITGSTVNRSFRKLFQKLVPFPKKTASNIYRDVSYKSVTAKKSVLQVIPSASLKANNCKLISKATFHEMCRDLFWLPPSLNMWNKKNSSFCTLVWYNHSILFPIPFARVCFLHHKVASKKGKHTDTQFNSLWRGVYLSIVRGGAVVGTIDVIFETSLFIYEFIHTGHSVHNTPLYI